MKAQEVIRLLGQRHAGDVFVPECKDGPTQYGSHVRLDAWAMKKSWANPATFGYEVKVRRSDFLNDNKWPGYLPLCSQFYFVCPYGLIEPEEIPEGCGLMYVAKTGTRLYTKRKAPPRDVQIPDSLWRYILMCRVKVTREHWDSEPDTDYWRRWLAEKHERQEIGHAVRGRVNQLYHEIKVKNIELEHRMEGYDQMRERIKELGFDPDTAVYTWQIKRKLDELVGRVSPRLMCEAKTLARELKSFLEELEALK